MPVIGLKNQFVPLILNGTKRQTIRSTRKRPFKNGDILYLYKNHRTPQAEKIGEYECKSVENIEMNFSPYKDIPGIWEVILDGKGLTGEEVREIARADGFKTNKEFFDFFLQNHGTNFKGQLIKW